MIDDKSAISKFDRAAATIVSIDILKSDEVHFLLFEDAVVAHLIAGLLLVELVFKHVNFIVQCLEFEEEGTCV